MRTAGKGFRAIACELNEQGIIAPKDYYYQSKNRKNPRASNRLWNDSSIKVIIRNEAYIGNIVQGKSGSESYKTHKQVRKPEDEWIRVENKHEPLIERELWERVQELDRKKYKPRRCIDGETNLFIGLLYCADCDFRFRANVERGKRKDGSDYKYVYYLCSNYARSGKTACTCHGIYEKVLSKLVVEHIRTHAQMVECNEDYIVEALISAQKNETMSYRAAYQSELEAHKKQVAKLDLLIENLYEDKVTGVVPDSLFRRHIQKYEQDRAERLQSLETLEQRIRNIRENADSVSSWAKLIKLYTKLDTLDSETLLLLIDRIIVGETQVIDRKKVCDIQIIYNYVGDIDRLGLTPA